MSDALKYLMEIRPEAMRNYFAFLKKSGEHLDDKTRAIISVITKVDKQTESGFRQYLKRALQTGVSPNELIDALFVAFPTLGLSKIVWAADILLAMDLPEFHLQNMQTETSGWHRVAALRELKPGGNHVKDCDDKDLFVYHDDKVTRVYDSLCPHLGTSIPEIALQGCELTCPLHHWKFDLVSGECIANGFKPLQCFESKIEEQALWAIW